MMECSCKEINLFIEKVKADNSLQAELKEATSTKLVAELAQREGYNFSINELNQAYESWGGVKTYGGWFLLFKLEEGKPEVKKVIAKHIKDFLIHISSTPDFQLKLQEANNIDNALVIAKEEGFQITREEFSDLWDLQADEELESTLGCSLARFMSIHFGAIV